MLFDLAVVTPEIELSEDPILNFRHRAAQVSHDRRSRGERKQMRNVHSEDNEYRLPHRK
jgi:hypothetical protein